MSMGFRRVRVLTANGDGIGDGDRGDENFLSAGLRVKQFVLVALLRANLPRPPVEETGAQRG